MKDFVLYDINLEDMCLTYVSIWGLPGVKMGDRKNRL